MESEDKLGNAPVGRYFVNPYDDYNDEEDEGDVNAAQMTELILTFARHSMGVSPTSKMEGGIYVGGAGIAYMVIHMCRSKLEYPITERVIAYRLAERALQNQIVHYQKTPKKDDFYGFLIGQPGVDAVAAVFYNMTGMPDSCERHLQEFASAASTFKSTTYRGSDELLVGRAGYLCGCLWLQEMLGKCPVPQEDLKAIWLGVIESGQRYSTLNKSPCPLMYAYYETEYLGAAHGLSSILQILLSFPNFCLEFPEHEKTIRSTIDYYLTLQYPSGNFPPEMDDVRAGSLHPDYELVHFCHGAPGAIYLLAKAYLHYKQDKFLEASINCGNCIWEKGILRKGPGLCHGVAGNGYAFLLLYRLTRDRSYLYKAKKFQEFMNEDAFQRYSRTPDCPQSLFEGTAGLVCYLTDLLSPTEATFPFFNIFYNYKPAETTESKPQSPAAQPST